MPFHRHSAAGRFPLKKILLLLAGFALVDFVLLISVLIFKPLDEWLGLSQVYFDQSAIEQGHFPKNATRAFYCVSGFTDSASWEAYSADRDTLDRAFRNLAEHPEKISDWPPRQDPSRVGIVRSDLTPPISPPPRAAWRNRGYWQITPKSRGKFYDSNNTNGDRRWVQAFYDTENSRLYYTILVP